MEFQLNYSNQMKKIIVITITPNFVLVNRVTILFILLDIIIIPLLITKAIKSIKSRNLSIFIPIRGINRINLDN